MIDLAQESDEPDDRGWMAGLTLWDNPSREMEPRERRQDGKHATMDNGPRRLTPVPGIRTAADPPVELEALIHAMAHGDTGALTSLYDATVGKVAAIARAILRNLEDAEEVTCDVFTQAWQTAHRFDGTRGSVLGWLQTIARTRSIDLLRQRNLQARLIDSAEASLDAREERQYESPEDCLGQFQSGTAVHEALAGLSPLRRQLVGLAFFRDMSHAEIALQTGLPVGTVKTHLRRSLQWLREALDGGRDEAEETRA